MLKRTIYKILKACHILIIMYNLTTGDIALILIIGYSFFYLIYRLFLFIQNKYFMIMRTFSNINRSLETINRLDTDVITNTCSNVNNSLKNLGSDMKYVKIGGIIELINNCCKMGEQLGSIINLIKKKPSTPEFNFDTPVAFNPYVVSSNPSCYKKVFSMQNLDKPTEIKLEPNMQNLDKATEIKLDSNLSDLADDFHLSI